MFTGFTDETVDFMWGIRFNNDRSWFEPRKDLYRRCFYEPMRELGEEMHAYLQTLCKDEELVCRVTRIYRDARRLHGRGPYKDRLWFCIERPSEDWLARPTFWFELTPESWGYGMGYWMTKPVDMAKLRARIERDPAPMTRLTQNLLDQTEFTLDGQRYKRPRGVPPTELLSPWYTLKSVIITHEDRLTEELFSRAVVDRMQAGYRFLLPYYEYFFSLDGDPIPENW